MKTPKKLLNHINLTKAKERNKEIKQSMKNLKDMNRKEITILNNKKAKNLHQKELKKALRKAIKDMKAVKE